MAKKPEEKPAYKNYEDTNHVFVPSLVTDDKINCEAYVVLLKPHAAKEKKIFANYSLTRIIIENDRVVYKEHSDPYMAADLENRFIYKLIKHMEKLRKAWPEGYDFAL